MHRTHTELEHEHSYQPSSRQSEARIRTVIILNALTMVAEIAAGMVFGSLALLADGWHMGTHLIALGITLAAYAIARRYISDTRFAFGTWKVEVLGGYTSAVLLGIVAVSMCWAAVERILDPIPIRYDQALLVAVIGLLVNAASALVLGLGVGRSGRDTHVHHGLEHDTGIRHVHRHHDLNMRAAYLHVVTDALTSILAITALVAAKYLSWNFFDPVAGIVGALLIIRWTYDLLKASGSILLDLEDRSPLAAKVRETVESDGVSKVSDLHLWQIARGKYACILAVVTKKDMVTIAGFKERLRIFPSIVHVSVELHHFRPET